MHGDPAEMWYDEATPPIVITGFNVFNKPVTPGEEVLGTLLLQMPVSETGAVELSHRHSVFSFNFAALHYARPKKNSYAYMMEGLERDWNYVGDRNYATFTTLPPGDYVFRVKASNSDGSWNNEGIAMKVRIVPPIWET